MNSKYLATLLIVFGLLFTFAQCRQLALRDQGDDDDDNSGGGNSEEDNASLDEEKRAIFNYLQDEQDASQFLDRSRRLFSGDQKSHMKEAKKKYEEKCERLLHPRYCPDLATWPAWNQAFNSASGKK